MPETAIAEEPVETQVETPVDSGEPTVKEPGFGNMAAAFDEAFPSTAKKELEPAAAPEVPQPVVPVAAPKTEAVATVPEKKPDTQGLPEAIFGDRKESVAAPEPEIEVPKGITKEKDIQSWKQLRTAYETEKRERARESSDFVRQLAEAKAADPGAQATIDELKRQNQELLQTVERSNVERHPKFQNEIVHPLKQARKEAHKLLEDAQVNPKLLDKALALDGSDRMEALDQLYGQLPEYAKAELAASVLQIRRLEARRDQILQNAHGTAERLQQQDTISNHEQLQQREQTLLKLADAAVTHLRDKIGFEVFIKSDDPNDKWWNDQVDERLSDMRRLLTNEPDPSQHALAAGLAVSAPFYRDLAIKVRQENKELKAELAAIKGAEPRLDGGGNGAAPAEDEKLSFAESVARGSGLR